MIQVLIALGLVGIVVFLVRSTRGERGSSLKCTSCRHFRGAEDDGAFCGYGDIEQFKTFADIEKCLDHNAPG